MNPFKVGDKVMLIENYGDHLCGSKGVVTFAWTDPFGLTSIKLDSGGKTSCHAKRLRKIGCRYGKI